LTVSPVNEWETGARPGSRTLEMLASSISCQILRSLSAGPMALDELGDDLGSTIEIPGRDSEYTEARITPSGKEMLFVSDTLEDWLAKTPKGFLPFGGDGATEAIEALADSWSSTMLHSLATGPRSLDELDGASDATGYPSPQRCLDAMRLSGQVMARRGAGEDAAYSVTDWLRLGVAPIVAAARMEDRHLADSPDVAPLDVEACFLLSVPLVHLPVDMSGSCRFALELDNAVSSQPAGVMVQVEEGRIVACTSDLQGDPKAGATGDLTTWFDAVIEANPDDMELGGDRGLAMALIYDLHRVLFGGASLVAG
jgi:DNA-binding HxlR family transcriptional regulator